MVRVCFSSAVTLATMKRDMATALTSRSKDQPPSPFRRILSLPLDKASLSCTTTYEGFSDQACCVPGTPYSSMVFRTDSIGSTIEQMVDGIDRIVPDAANKEACRFLKNLEDTATIIGIIGNKCLGPQDHAPSQDHHAEYTAICAIDNDNNKITFNLFIKFPCLNNLYEQIIPTNTMGLNTNKLFPGERVSPAIPRNMFVVKPSPSYPKSIGFPNFMTLHSRIARIEEAVYIE